MPPDAVPPLPGPRRAAFVFIFITVLLDMLALGMIVPILPKLVVSFAGGREADGAEVLGLFQTVWAAMQFVCSPLLGALSDQVGRRKLILLSNFGTGLDYLLMAAAPSLGWLFLGRVLSGVTAASIGTASAYIADVTPPEQRAERFGMLGAAFGIGFILGPAVGGLLGSVSPRLPFWAAAGLSLANALYGLLVLRESLPVEKRTPFQWSAANPVGSIKLLSRTASLLRLAIVTFLASLAHVVLPSTFVLYAGYRYHWQEREVGLVLAGVGLASMVVQATLVRPVVARLGERRTMLMSLVAGAAGMAIYGLAPTGLWFGVGIPVMAIWGLSGPSVQGLMTREVSESQQGQLQGAIASLQGITEMVGPLLFTSAFALAIDPARGPAMPGFPFMIASMLLGTAALLSWRFFGAPAPAPA